MRTSEMVKQPLLATLLTLAAYLLQPESAYSADFGGLPQQLIGGWSVACQKGPSAWRQFRDNMAIGPGSVNISVTRTTQDGSRYQVYFSDGTSELFDYTERGIYYLAKLRANGTVAINLAAKGAPLLLRCDGPPEAPKGQPSNQQSVSAYDGMRPSTQLLLKSLNQTLISNLKYLPVDWTQINSAREVKLAFSISYSNGADVHMNTVFFQSRDIGNDCHGCKPDLGALVFQGSGNSITLHSTQATFTTAGTWGDSTKDDSDIFMASKNGIVTLLVKEYFMGQGRGTEYYNVFLYDDHAWYDAGLITSGYSNAQAYDDSESSKIYSFEGNPKLTETPTNFYDIVIARTGEVCLSHQNGDCIKKRVADNCVYKFSSSGYITSRGTECEAFTDGVSLTGIDSDGPRFNVKVQSPSPENSTYNSDQTAHKAIMRIYRFM